MREAEHSPSSLEACCPPPSIPSQDRCCPDPTERRPGQLPRSRDGQPGEALLHVAERHVFHRKTRWCLSAPFSCGLPDRCSHTCDTHTLLPVGVPGLRPIPCGPPRRAEDRGAGVTFYKIYKFSATKHVTCFVCLHPSLHWRVHLTGRDLSCSAVHTILVSRLTRGM